MPKGNEDLKLAIAKRIVKCREDHGITQQELADRAGVSLQFVGSVECGRKGIGIDTAIRFAKVLNVSTDYLLLGETHEADAHYFEEVLSALDETQMQDAKNMMKALANIISKEEAYRASKRMARKTEKQENRGGY